MVMNRGPLSRFPDHRRDAEPVLGIGIQEVARIPLTGRLFRLLGQKIPLAQEPPHRRLGRLDEPSQEALRVASVEGEVFTAEVVAQVRATGEQEMVARLSGDEFAVILENARGWEEATATANRGLP